MAADHPATSNTSKPVTHYYQPHPATSSKPVRQQSAPTPVTPAKPKRETDWAALLAYASLIGVGICVVIMSWNGLVGFAEHTLGITGNLRYVVPVSLDGSALTMAFFALQSALHKRAAGWPRLLALLIMGASAGFNYWHARTQGQGGAAEAFYAGMSVLVYLMFDVGVRQIRRRELERAGVIEPPLARFRFARWLWFPWRTLGAWRLAVDQGVTDPEDALIIARAERADRKVERRNRRRKPVQPEMSEARAEHGQAPDQDVPEPPSASPQVSAQAREPVASKHSEPASKRARNEDARRTVRAMLLEHGDTLTAKQAGDAVGLSRSRGQQLIVQEKAALAAAKGRGNGTTPEAS